MNLAFNRLILFVLSHICMYFIDFIKYSNAVVFTHSNYRIISLNHFYIYFQTIYSFVLSILLLFFIHFGYKTILLVEGPSYHHHNSIQFAFTFQFYTFHISVSNCVFNRSQKSKMMQNYHIINIE